jgi:hypothetical protein
MNYQPPVTNAALVVSATAEYQECRRELEAAKNYEALERMAELEKQIVQFEGFPPGSLNLFQMTSGHVPQTDWQEAIEGWQEANRAHNELMNQRALSHDDLAVFYSVQSRVHSRKIILAAAVAPGITAIWKAPDCQ